MNRDRILRLLELVLGDPLSRAIVLCRVFGFDEAPGDSACEIGFELLGCTPLGGAFRPEPCALYAWIEDLLEDEGASGSAVAIGSIGPGGEIIDVSLFRLRLEPAAAALDEELARAAGFRLVAGGSA